MIASFPDNDQQLLTDFGQRCLAPVFAAFSLLLLHEVRTRHIDRLGFVARDGDFLRQATAQLIDALNWAAPPQLDYVHLSRLSTNLAGRTLLNPAAWEEVRVLRNGAPLNLADFLAHFGLEAQHMIPLLSAHGLTAASPVPQYQPLKPLLQDPVFRSHVANAAERKRALLKRYLEESELFNSPRAAFVDIGWRGTIPAALDRAFAEDPDYRPLPNFYLGHWHELGCLPFPPGRIVGLLSDCQRRPGLREGAAYYLSLVLESVCRPKQGPVTGYRIKECGRQIGPILAPWNPSQQHAQAQADAELIRQGILSGISVLGKRWRTTPPDPATLRHETQKLLRDLAFFPRQDDLRALRRLCHTEGHHDHWTAPLIQHPLPSPWRQPRAWLAGLSSPWRSGYVAASGGHVLARLFCTMETILIALPPRFRQKLRFLARALAGKPRPPTSQRSKVSGDHIP